MYLIFSIFLFSSCQSQVKGNKKLQKDEAIKPKTNIVVHKEYDDNGNLISIDSTYSYVYSNIKNDSILEKKLYNNLKSNFNHIKGVNPAFMNNFFNDKMFKMNDFYTHDFFEKNMKQQEKEMQKLMRMFDSVKNQFYKNQFPLDESKKSKTLSKKLE